MRMKVELIDDDYILRDAYGHTVIVSSYTLVEKYHKEYAQDVSQEIFDGDFDDWVDENDMANVYINEFLIANCQNKK